MKPVRVYTTDYCGYCTRAKQFLQGKGVPYEEIDVSNDDALRADLIEKSNGQRTVPQIFIGDHHVGGYSDLMALESKGQLDPLLQ
jgi:glutaredoxin 3